MLEKKRETKRLIRKKRRTVETKLQDGGNKEGKKKGTKKEKKERKKEKKKERRIERKKE